MNKLIFKYSLITLIGSLVLVGCETKLINEWSSQPFIDAFGKENGVVLFINGEQLSENLDVAVISFSLVNDLISGGYKEMFTINLNNSSFGEDIIITDMFGIKHEFTSYDGMIFNIDYESNDIDRLMELMNNEELTISQGEYSFMINTKGFLNLYSEHFRQPNM